VLIADEAHYLKGWRSKRTNRVYGKACKGGEGSLAGESEHVWLLTGTPAPNHYGEVYPHLRALAPHLVRHPQKGRPMTPFEFEDRYCYVQNTAFGRQVSGNKNGAELKQVLSKWALRRRKKDVLTQLPPLRVVATPLTFSSEGQQERAKALAQVDRELRKGLGDVTPEHPEEALQALHSRQSELSSLRRQLGVLKAADVVQFVTGMLEGGTDKLVLFGVHHEVLDRMKSLLAGYSPVSLDGRDTARARGEAIKRFQEDPKTRVIVCQIQAAGTAVTLTAASDVVFAEGDWTPANMLQASARCHRIGQTQSVLAQLLYLPGTLDEAIQRVLSRKTTQLGELFM